MAKTPSQVGYFDDSGEFVRCDLDADDVINDDDISVEDHMRNRNIHVSSEEKEKINNLHNYDDASIKSLIKKNADDIENLSNKVDAIPDTSGILEEATSYADAKADETLQSAINYVDSKLSEDEEPEEPSEDAPLINKLVVISEEGWVDDTEGRSLLQDISTDVESYPFYYDITIDGVKSDDLADIIFVAENEKHAKKYGFSPKVSCYEGYVRIRASEKPEIPLSAYVQVTFLFATNRVHFNSGDNGGESVEEHNNDPESHPDIRKHLNELDGRLKALENKETDEDGANSFTVTFGNLDGLSVTGVWNESNARLCF